MRESKMKKALILVGIIIVGLAFCGLVFTFFLKAVDGKEITRGDYVITVSAKGKEIRIVKYNGDDEVVNIPKRMFMIPVVGIGDSAFRDNSQIKKVVFPATLRTIRSNAFNNCTALEDVVFNGELYWIYDHAFFNCCSLKELNIPYSNQLRVEESAFESCTDLESVNFNNGNVGLETYAFYDCEKLEVVQGVDGEMAAASDAFDNTAFLNTYAFGI